MIFLIIIIIIKEIVSKMGCDLKKKITVGEFSYFIILNGKKKKTTDRGWYQSPTHFNDQKATQSRSRSSPDFAQP